MYSLIGLGVGIAYLFSLAALLMPGIFPQEFREHHGAVGIYFEAAAVIVTLVILGDVLQLRAMGKTSQAIRQLLELAPSAAWRVQPDGSEEQVPMAEIKVGDRLRVKPGEVVMKKVMKKDRYKPALRSLQVELVKLQRHFIGCGDRILVVLEGRDAPVIDAHNALFEKRPALGFLEVQRSAAQSGA